ncbi:amino acid ABC transporter ATP-binding protein [Arthrobacter sp. VKM Ac-2550]|uniref:amino acid ABC transporter ATP-binding protein n=1 Tax=Crystallibacter permensis TaxID=1938888 RepID=UPI0022280AA4|nr:amino acid ABC transporter ATP-binding protein [Arthrobacter sp. VKM Ac-2550]MCW2131627.1 amino acid ABC transporter ATP-binding protein, PAAT family [Arthrobacter sp. VKM Ac-2550]
MTDALATHRTRPAAATASPLLVASNVRKQYGSVEVLKGISLTVNAGEVMCLLGPSGSGKSTFLRCINHLERIDGGRISVAGELIGYAQRQDRVFEMNPREVARQRRSIGMVFQRFNLFPHMSALENIWAAPVGVKKVPKQQALKRGMELLDRVGLAHLAKAYPAQLSGGQQQRVAIARALAMDPQLLLFDEPTSALDPELVGDVLDVMRTLAADGMTMIVVTHEIGFARSAADNVVFMDGGVVVESGVPAAVFDNPQHPRTTAFLNSVM